MPAFHNAITSGSNSLPQKKQIPAPSPPCYLSLPPYFSDLLPSFPSLPPPFLPIFTASFSCVVYLHVRAWPNSVLGHDSALELSFLWVFLPFIHSPIIQRKGGGGHLYISMHTHKRVRCNITAFVSILMSTHRCSHRRETQRHNLRLSNCIFSPTLQCEPVW